MIWFKSANFAQAANLSFGAAVVLAAVSLCTFIRYHEGIFGRAEHYDDGP